MFSDTVIQIYTNTADVHWAIARKQCLDSLIHTHTYFHTSLHIYIHLIYLWYKIKYLDLCAVFLNVNQNVCV